MKAPKAKTFLDKYWSFLIFGVVAMAMVFSVFNASTQARPQLENCSSLKCSSSSIRLISGCGSGSGYVQTSIDFLCKGNKCPESSPHTASSPPYCNGDHNGIVDLLFAIIRFLSDGVGLVVIASVIIGGIQYITAGGDPNSTKKAISRLTSSGIALAIYIFAYAILNYVVPNGLLKQ